MMRAQFNIPTHPACVPLTDSHIEQGRSAIANCRELFAKYCHSPSRKANTGIADKHIKKVAPVKTALERSSLIAQAAELRHKEQQYREILKKRNLEVPA